MNISHIEHIGIAVKDLQSAIPYYEKVLGLSCYSVEEVLDQKVKTAFFKVGQTKIELLEATSDDSPIAKKREGIHHIAFCVDSVTNALAAAEANGITLIDSKPRKGAEGLHIAFLHPKSTLGILTELCENPK